MVWKSDIPNIFISYSWTSKAHEEWVLNLAERLMQDWILVKLDKWDLKEWQDLYKFMEDCVKSVEIKKVLVISDKEYQKKADNRKWWVWAESQLISHEVYSDVNQEKFIPIVKDKDENWKPCLPNFLKSRIYIDLSNDLQFEEEYEKLVRNIYGKPEHKKPSIWVAPNYILESEDVVTPIKIFTDLRKTKLKIESWNTNLNWNLANFLDTFIDNLESFRIIEIKWEIYEEIEKKINEMEALVEWFNDFIWTLFKYWEKVDLDIIKLFFEKFLSYSTKDISEEEHYKFLINEIFLNFVKILLELEKFKELSFFLNTTYFYKSEYWIQNWNFSLFYNYIRTLDEIKNSKLNLHRVSIKADILSKRSKNFESIIECDLTLYYISLLTKDYDNWFPTTAVYWRWKNWILIFKKMISKRHCEKIFELFNAKSIEELKSLVKKIQEKQNESRINDFHYRIVKISEIIKAEEIWTLN